MKPTKCSTCKGSGYFDSPTRGYKMPCYICNGTGLAESKEPIPQVNRFEVIDHTASGTGREFVKWLSYNFKVVLVYQDDGKTLKVFLQDTGEATQALSSAKATDKQNDPLPSSPSNTKPCRHCDGTGKAYIDPPRSCPRCNGTGKEAKPQLIHADCGIAHSLSFPCPPGKPQDRKGILSLPEDEQRELFTKAAERSSKRQAEFMAQGEPLQAEKPTGTNTVGGLNTTKLEPNQSEVKLYHLMRDEDVSGTSGTGLVAEVAEFSNGWCAVAFMKHTAGISNIIVYGDINHVELVHGHGGKTKLVPASRNKEVSDE